MTRRRLEPLAITAWALMANTVTTSALGVVFWAVASRRYSPQALGQDAALISAMILLSSVSQLNLSMGITRLLPQVQVRRWRPVMGSYALTAVTGVILTAAFLVLAPQLSDGFAFLAEDSSLAFALVGAVVLWNIFGLQDAVLTSARWAAAVPIENGLFGLLKIALMVWLADGFLGHGVFFAWLLAMAVLLLPVNALIFSRVLQSSSGRGARGSPTAVPLGERALVTRYLATDYFAALLSQGSGALLPLLVLGVLGTADNAYFYVAFLITAAIAALAQSLSISLVVEGAYDEANLVALARRSAGRYIRFVAPAVAVLILAAPMVLRPFGAAYVANGTTLLRLLLAGTMAKAVVTLYLGVERVRARVSRVLAAEAATLVLVATGAVLGMKASGLVGLGVAWLVAQLSVAIVVLPRLWRLLAATSDSSRWRLLEEHLDRGAALGVATTVAGCSKPEVVRLTSHASGAWSDLLGDVNGARVLIVDRSPSHAPRRLVDRGAIVGVADDSPDRLAVRRRLLEGRPTVLASRTSQFLGAAWDIVCFDGVRLDAALLRSAVEALAPDGRIVVVADNRWSPLRLADRVLRRSTCAPAMRLPPLTRMLSTEGLAYHQVFGLLRSSSTPTSSFNVASRGAAAEVLLAAAPHFGRVRLLLLALMNGLVRAGWVAAVVPAWAVIARAQPAQARAEVVGRIGYDWSRGARILFGEPPLELEKHYETTEEADAEAMALAALTDAGLDIGPRLLNRPTARSCRITWCEGRPLSVRSLSAAQRRVWVEAAAILLQQMQESTRLPDGSVLVHHDFWLGNLLVRDGTISAVIDWGSARWGAPEVDADFLVDSLGDFCHLGAAEIDHLRRCRDQALSSTRSVLLRAP